MSALNVDDLLRTSASRNAELAASAEALINRTEGDLFSMLGTMAAHRTGNFDGSYRSLVDEDDLHRDEVTTNLGKRIFSRWSRAVHDFACLSDGEDENLKDQLLQAIFSKGRARSQ